MKLFAVLLALCAPLRAADVYIGVQGPDGGLLKLALPPLRAADPRKPADALLAARAREVLRGDLLFSRRFSVVEEGPATAGLGDKELAAQWAPLARAAVLGQVSDLGGSASMTFKLYDLGAGQALLEKSYGGPDWRASAHDFADKAVLQLTGKPGIAHTRIAFANDESGYKEIYVADYDGANLRRLSKDRSICVLPRWSPDGSAVYYTTYKQNNPDLYSVSASGGEARVVSARQGLNLAGGFSPDGRTLLVTLSESGTPQIFQLRLADRRAEPVLASGAIETSPTYSPDGAQIAFVSDRSGNPQIYVADAATGRTRRLTKMNWCDSPAWSPTGEAVVFAARETPHAHLQIFTVDLTGEQLRQLTEASGDNEDPSWSPDGRFIAYTNSRGGRKRIYVMDADGSAPHLLLDVPGNSSTASWGP